MTEVKEIPVPLDEFGELAKQKLAKQIEEYNAMAAVVNAASGDPQGLLEALRTSSDNEEVQKITAAIEQLDNKREELWKHRDELLKPVVEAEIEAAKSGLGDKPEQLAKIAATIKTARKYLTENYCAEVLEDLPAMAGKRAGGSSAGGGSGARRIRGFDFFVDGNLVTSRDAKGNESSNAAAAAKHVGLTTEDIRQAFWAAAGTDDSSKYPPVVEFTVTVTEGDESKAFSIVAKRVATEDGSDD